MILRRLVCALRGHPVFRITVPREVYGRTIATAILSSCRCGRVVRIVKGFRD